MQICSLSLSLFTNRFWHWCFPDSYLNFFNNNFFKEYCYKKKKHCYKKRGSDICCKSNYVTFYLTSARFLYFSTVHSDNGLYIVLSVEKKLLKVVDDTTTIGIWQSLTCHNSHADISPLVLMTDLIDIYALLPENISFLECFLWSHIYFIRYCNNPTEITQSHFCGVFLKNHKYLREMFLRRLREVTEKTSFLRHARDVLKTSHKRYLFRDVFETS